MKRGFPRRKSCPPDFGAVTAAAAQSRPTERMTSPFASSIELNIVIPHRFSPEGPADAPVSACRHGEEEASGWEARPSPGLICVGSREAHAGPPLADCDKCRQRLDGPPSLGAGWLLTPRLLKYKHSRSVRNSDVIRYAPQASAEILRPLRRRQAVQGTGRVPAN